jgi:hypothetical protein
MRWVQALGVVWVVLVLAGSTEAGEQKKKKKKKEGVIAGQVVEVAKGKDDGLGSITVKAVSKKGGTGQESKIEITKDTKIEKVTGKKGERKHTDADFAALHKGERVVIHTRAGNSNQAERVEIIAGKKKKNKAAG